MATAPGSNLNNVAYVAAQMGKRPSLRRSTYAHLLAPFDQLEFMPTTSASATVILSGVMRVKPSVRVFIKIFPERPSKRGGSVTLPLDNLLNESDIYNELFKLREFSITPNILARVDTYTLLAQDKFLDEPVFDTVRFNVPGGAGRAGVVGGKVEYIAQRQQELATAVSKVPLAHQWELQPEQWTTTRCIITRSIEASLHHVMVDRIGECKLSYSEVVPILYQIMHTLCVFEHFQIAHHDLHLRNIRVEEHDAPIDLYYRQDSEGREEEHVRVRTKYVVKLFDFDRSSIYKTTPLAHRGEVMLQAVRSDPDNMFKFSTFNPKEDAFKVLHHILARPGVDEPKRRELLHQIIPGYNSLETLHESYMTINQREQPWVKAIVAPYADEEECQPYLALSFKKYFKKIKKYHMLSMPPGQMSKFSVYLPDHIMQPNAAILKSLVKDAENVTVTVVLPPIEYGLQAAAVANRKRKAVAAADHSQITPKRFRPAAAAAAAAAISEHETLIEVIHDHRPLSVTDVMNITMALRSILVKFDHANQLYPLFIRALRASNNEVVLGMVVGMLAAFNDNEAAEALPNINNILPMFSYFQLPATPATIQEQPSQVQNVDLTTKAELIGRVVKNISTNTEISDSDIGKLYSVFAHAHLHGVFSTFQKINSIHCGLLVILLVVVTVEQTRAYTIFTNFVHGALTNLLHTF